MPHRLVIRLLGGTIWAVGGLPWPVLVEMAQPVCWICRPLLLRIKTAYDEALKDAAAAACDNVYLQSKMAMVPHRHVSCEFECSCRHALSCSTVLE
jgi:hypothetical protein